MENGKDAEIAVRKKYFEGIEAEKKNYLQEYGDIERQAEEKRKELRRNIEQGRDEERKKIAEARKKILSSQNNKIDSLLEELAEKEKKLNEPIDDSTLIDPIIKPGKITYASGEFDHYGNRVERPQETFKQVLKDLNELSMDELEELLIHYEFDFFEVWGCLSLEYNSTPESLRIAWFEYTDKLESLNELE